MQLKRLPMRMVVDRSGPFDSWTLTSNDCLLFSAQETLKDDRECAGGPMTKQGPLTFVKCQHFRSETVVAGDGGACSAECEAADDQWGFLELPAWNR